MLVLVAMVLGVLATVFASRAERCQTAAVKTRQPTICDPDAQRPAELVLKVQTPWVGPGGLFEAEIGLPQDHGAGELRGTVREAVAKASELTPDPEDGLGLILAEIDSIPVSASRDTLTVRVPIAGREAASRR